MQTICIMCPMGCNIEVTQDGENFTVSGNTCKRGEVYGIAEKTAPVRMVTSLVRYFDGVTSVKTSVAISKSKISEVLAEIKKIHIRKDVVCGTILQENIANSGADLIVTGNI